MSETLIRVENGIGRITLNRPRALNALTLGMIQAIDLALVDWADDAGIRAVLVDGAGERGLCAGGDIRAIYDAPPDAKADHAADFFRAEYRMNARIAAFPKPYVALMDGITMGGGVGVSAHGRIRIVTERSRLAMPETAIGFVPDVGGTHLLAHAPGELGTYVALSAHQFGAADAILLGLADLYVDSAAMPGVIAAINGRLPLADGSSSLAKFSEPPPAAPLEKERVWIERCFAHDEVEDILAALRAAPEEGARKAAADIAGKSPTSLKITLRALREARADNNLLRALEREFRLAMACVGRRDFREGVRAAIVDKDRNPRWSPASLSDVPAAEIDAMFSPSRYGTLGLAA